MSATVFQKVLCNSLLTRDNPLQHLFPSKDKNSSVSAKKIQLITAFMFYIKETFLIVCALITTVPESKLTSLRFGIVLVRIHQQWTFLEISIPFFYSPGRPSECLTTKNVRLSRNIIPGSFLETRSFLLEKQ